MGFSSIIGNKRAVEILKRAIACERPAHAYLFIGPDGVGKKLLALSFAKAINCLERKEDGDSCNLCISCRKIDSLNHPDIIIVKPDGKFIKIDQIRTVQRQLQFKSLEGRYKVCIIDGAESMNLSSANALLKTLEEPPEGTILILVAGRRGSLPATIISRCQRIGFSPLNKDELIPWLKNRIAVNDDTARLMVAFGGGSISRTLEAKEEIVTEARKDVIKRFSKILSGDMEEAFRLAEELSRMENLDNHLEILKIWLRDLMVYKRLGNEDFIINYDLAPHLEDDSRRLSLSRIIELWKRVSLCQRAIYYNANKQIALEYMFLGNEGASGLGGWHENSRGEI